MSREIKMTGGTDFLLAASKLGLSIAKIGTFFEPGVVIVSQEDVEPFVSLLNEYNIKFNIMHEMLN